MAIFSYFVVIPRLAPIPRGRFVYTVGENNFILDRMSTKRINNYNNLKQTLSFYFDCFLLNLL